LFDRCSLTHRAPVSATRAANASEKASSAATPSSSEEFTYLKVELPTPENTRIKSASFVKSSPSVKQCPPDVLPEFALIGRSNVGKSSLINNLAGSQKLAKVSKEPGMTKLINHYLINESWYIVDLPGYGFAKTATKEERNKWLDFTKDFFIHRDNLVHVLLLIDSSVPPQQVDIDCANWLADCEVPFAIVFTKLDMRKKDSPSAVHNIPAFKRILARDWEALPLCFETSSKTGAGKTELLAYLASLRILHNTNKD